MTLQFRAYKKKIIITLTIITPNKKIITNKSSQQKNTNILEREITLNLHITSLIFHGNQNSKFVKITLLKENLMPRSSCQV